MENNRLIEAMRVCKGIVSLCECRLLIVNLVGVYRVYLCKCVVYKGSIQGAHTVQDAKDITDLVYNSTFNFAGGMNYDTLEVRTKSIPKENFSFGTDDFMFIEKVENLNLNGYEYR